MKRRQAIKAMIVSPLILAGPVAAQEPENTYYGALKPLQPPKRVTFRQAFQAYRGISKGKRAHLWKFYELATGGALIPHNQPDEGDCVGQGYALGCDLLAACDIFMHFEPEKFVAKASVEMIYAGSRVQIGKGEMGRWDGSYGQWAARFVHDYGVLHRLKYANGENNINLEGYDNERSNYYSTRGVPTWLESIARQHPVATYTKIENYRQACDALYMGQPVVLCSSYAFESTRDADGFAAQYLGGQKRVRWRWVWSRRKWFHCLLLAGFDETRSRPGGLIINSWGPDWIDGPKALGQPEGSFFVEPDELDRMLSEWENCYALSSYVGHPQKRLNHRLY